jgi:WhiB family redox-sensing transcriptional regulator
MMRDEDWRDHALCKEVDPQIFFEETPGVKSTAAKSVCRRCDVQPQCLEYALNHNEWGIWGGTSINQRKLLRRQRGIRLSPVDTIVHGTSAGARAHYRLGETPCRACADAQRIDGRLRRA